MATSVTGDVRITHQFGDIILPHPVRWWAQTRSAGVSANLERERPDSHEPEGCAVVVRNHSWTWLSYNHCVPTKADLVGPRSR